MGLSTVPSIGTYGHFGATDEYRAFYDESRSSGGGNPDGDEDSVEYEGEEYEAGGIDFCASPRFRQLVRQKKLELKAQYGKGHWYDKLGDGKAPQWIPGWRKKWREFKHAGGLAQLKLQSKCLDVPGSTPPKSKVPFAQRFIPGNLFKKSEGLSRGDSSTAPGATTSRMASDEQKKKLIVTAIVIVLIIAVAWYMMRKYISGKN